MGSNPAGRANKTIACDIAGYFYFHGSTPVLRLLQDTTHAVRARLVSFFGVVAPIGLQGFGAPVSTSNAEQ
jgi:hypothetical protein